MESDTTVIAGKKAIIGALTLYLDFINLFLMLLQLSGERRESGLPVPRVPRPGVCSPPDEAARYCGRLPPFGRSNGCMPLLFNIVHGDMKLWMLLLIAWAAFSAASYVVRVPTSVARIRPQTIRIVGDEGRLALEFSLLSASPFLKSPRRDLGHRR